MGTVHRNGLPPKKLHFKQNRIFKDMEFHEELILKWCRETLLSHMQYDYTVFNGSKGKLNRTIDFVAWFQTKTDAERFRQQWM